MAFLHQEDGAPGGVNYGGIKDAVFGGDHDFEIAAFAGLAEVFDGIWLGAAAAMRSR